MLADIKRLIDKASQAELYEPPRGHLGASQIGNRCFRAAWYSFRWAYQEAHTGRMLRLFRRGHEEEDRIYRWMRAAGFEVRDYTQMLVWHGGSGSYAAIDWDEEINPTDDLDFVYDSPHHIAVAKAQGIELKQWGFKDHEGHFAGSSDGKIKFPEGFKIKGRDVPTGWGLAECKTSNDKSFKQVVAKGVLSAKPVHYVQMQIYMRYLGLEWALYIAVNKNDDDMYFEIIYAKPELADQYRELAANIITMPSAPPRLTDNPSWFECKFCAFREICHYGDVPQKNCRSCAMAAPAEDGQWYCRHHHATIPKTFLPNGCDDWTPIS